MWKKYTYTFIGGIVVGALSLTACQPAEEEPAGRSEDEDLIIPPAFTCEQMNGERVCEAKSLEGEDGETLRILVTIPEEIDQVWDVVVQTEPIDQKTQYRMDEADLPFDSEESSLMLVTNLKIIEDPEGKKENPPPPFDPPMLLQVEYTEKQWAHANEIGLKTPRLVFFNLETGEWEELPIHDLFPGEDDNLENGGYLIIEIFEWFDPPIGLVS